MMRIIAFMKKGKPSSSFKELRAPSVVQFDDDGITMLINPQQSLAK